MGSVLVHHSRHRTLCVAQVSENPAVAPLLLRSLELGQHDAPTAAFALRAIYNLSSQRELLDALVAAQSFSWSISPGDQHRAASRSARSALLPRNTLTSLHGVVLVLHVLLRAAAGCRGG